MHLKRNFHYIIPEREGNIIIKSESLVLRKRKVLIKILIIYLLRIFSMTFHFLRYFSSFCSIALILVKYSFKLAKQAVPCSLDI